jgi:hypothetical protein
VRVSDYYALGTTQGGLDFVDVDITNDVPIYIDPAAIRRQSGDWADLCHAAIGSFFESLITAIKNDDIKRIRGLIRPLSEPNETHLGDSAGESQGRGLGNRATSDRLVAALAKSKAAKSGLMQDLEETALFIEGIDKDIISDMTTCIIRQHLIEYTQNVCRYHQIPLERQESGAVWNTEKKAWEDGNFVDLPRAGGNKLLLVPKSIVRVKLSVDRGRYYRGYLRPYLEAKEWNSGSSLIEIVRGEPTILKKKLDKKYGTTKEATARNTVVHPEAVASYRQSIQNEANSPLSGEDLSEHAGIPTSDCWTLLREMQSIRPGTEGANLYHHAVANLISCLFGTSLGNRHIEQDLHGKLKRMDIVYDNIADDGFFRWLAWNYKSSTIVVECKNYSGDLKNPEIDQLAMRFSNDRGRIGFLTCRSLHDKEKALARCKAVAQDQNGFIILLDDGDFEDLVSAVESIESQDGLRRNEYPLLRERFRELVS